MYYKVLKDNKVIDVLDQLVYLRWNPKKQNMCVVGEDYAQAFLSSDQNTIWHEDSLFRIPVPGYDTVELIEINEHEYKQLLMLNNKTPEEIIDNFVMSLIEDGVI